MNAQGLDAPSKEDQMGKSDGGATSPLQQLVMADLKPMGEAPKDGTQILAYHKSGKFLHPVKWRDHTWMDCGTAHWNIMWCEDYRQYDCDFAGWIPYPEVKS
jgi:hypothetical protein